MQQDLREILGKALQQERCNLKGNWEWPWEQKIEETREVDRACAEAVVKKYLDILLPGFLLQVR